MPNISIICNYFIQFRVKCDMRLILNTPRFMISARSVLVLLLIAIAGVVHAEIISINPDRDNTLYERDAGELSNGSGPSLFFGQTGENANFVLRRALMRFDLSSIPPGSVIQNVSLAITVDLVPPEATGFDATLHRVMSDWGESSSFAPGAGGGGAAAATGDVTWIHTFFDDQFWTTPGGDFVSAASGSTALSNDTTEFVFVSQPGLVADVQAWVNQPSANFGWMLLGEEDNPANARRIGSRENSATPPVLTIEFERGPDLPEARAVPVMPTWSVGLLAGLMLLTAWYGLKLRTRSMRR